MELDFILQNISDNAYRDRCFDNAGHYDIIKALCKIINLLHKYTDFEDQEEIMGHINRILKTLEDER